MQQYWAIRECEYKLSELVEALLWHFWGRDDIWGSSNSEGSWFAWPGKDSRYVQFSYWFLVM